MTKKKAGVRTMFKKKKQQMQQDLILGCAALAFMAVLMLISFLQDRKN